jgi:hypothetical protein
MEKVTKAIFTEHASSGEYFPCPAQDRVAPRRPRLLPRLAGVAIAWTLLGTPGLYAQDSKPTEYQVKAAYLFNFGRYIGWPNKTAATKGGSFAICVLGRDPFGLALDTTLAGETLEGRSVVARRISRPQEAVDCRIVFVSLSVDGQLKEVLAELDKTGALTVSDMPSFSRRGGMIEFVLEGGRVRFEVNLGVAERAGLTLSAQLLKLAVSVRRSPQPGD